MSTRDISHKPSHLDRGVQSIRIGALCDIAAFPLTPPGAPQLDLSPKPPTIVSATYDPTTESVNESTPLNPSQSSTGSSSRHRGVYHSTNTTLQANINPTTRPSGNKYRTRQARSRGNTITTKMGSQPSKKRGRPGMSDDPESSAEKRRVQIRLAQRAYRSRQKAHVSLLEARICELETAVDSMAKSFLSFNDKVMQSGILEHTPGFTKEFKQVSEEFLRLVKDAMETVPETAEAEQTRTDSASYDAGRSEDSDMATSNSPEDLRDANISLLTNTTRTRGEDLPMRCPRSAPDVLPSCSSTQITGLSSPVFASGLDPAASDGFGPNSTSFAGRLRHACAQRGYRFLKDPSISSPNLYRVFGLLMSTMTRDDLIGYFETRLKTLDTRAVFEKWNIPMFSIGGAGTHYPRTSSSTNTPNGPSSSTRIEEDCIDASPFMSEDEWFDAKDVEGFLEEHEITLDRPQSASSSGQSPFESLCPSRKLVIDEALLIDHLPSLCICLGHTVGFRRRDIESIVFRYARPISQHQNSMRRVDESV
ncbi:hypothetical protein BBP40_004307 [Aspergillus hancockii]|nr:hypothetical protein BBP40_004307 [Aspergillus hancockii]